MLDIHSKNIQSLDERRDILIGGSKQETIEYAVKHFITLANQAITEEGKFTVALSGGSTPKAIYQELTHKYKDQIDWSKVFLFFSDERSVPPTSEESNYHMAMQAGFKDVPIPKTHIFRMKAEKEIEKGAQAYEKILEKHLGPDLFDLVMLGMGDDGHTASLFPNTDALSTHHRAVVANFVPQKNTWRMTLTFDCINNSSHTCLYVLGSSKADRVRKIFNPSENTPILPVEFIGTKENKALWILDKDAAISLYN